jgi:hypothetical protein
VLKFSSSAIAAGRFIPTADHLPAFSKRNLIPSITCRALNKTNLTDTGLG